MSEPLDEPPLEADEPKTRGPIDRWLARLGLARSAGAGADDAQTSQSRAAAELVDHAEAFQTLRVADVMTPRADITAVELSATFSALVAAFAESEHSRLPVYRETLDDPVGVVHLKDVFKLIAQSGGRESPSENVLRSIKRETLYVPPSMRGADLLVRMQASRIHMAMVIDEFGGVDGLVTLEDLIEAVVGEIDDEHDEAAAIQIVARTGGVFEVDARATLEDLQTALRRDLSTPEMDEDIDTAGGLVTALAGRVPQRGEVIAHPAGFEFEITDADPRKVKRLRIRPTAAAAPQGPSANG
ncbi:MAG TPA: hemolysin family protein [Caulobacteraceae bacterium]